MHVDIMDNPFLLAFDIRHNFKWLLHHDLNHYFPSFQTTLVWDMVYMFTMILVQYKGLCDGVYVIVWMFPWKLYKTVQSMEKDIWLCFQ